MGRMSELAIEMEELKQFMQEQELCGKCWEEIEFCFCHQLYEGEEDAEEYRGCCGE
jgi:hypothetical protein